MKGITEKILFTLVITFALGTSAYAGYRIYTNFTGNTDTAKSNNKTLGSASCIVTIEGNQYDVTNLRKTHSGGDIFVCGTDMTNDYIKQHGLDLSRISQYLVKPATNTQATPVNTNTTQQTQTTSGMTLAQLATHNNASSCYVAYNGTVYNATKDPAWSGCVHHGVRGGIDITSLFPHPTSYLSRLTIVGKLANGSSGSTSGTTTKPSNTLKYEYEEEYEYED